jgi:hypothetical protein
MRSLLLAVLEEEAPHVLQANGGRLQLSHDTVRRWAHRVLNWAPRKATSKAQQAPDNAKALVEEMLVRLQNKVQNVRCK